MILTRGYKPALKRQRDAALTAKHAEVERIDARARGRAEGRSDATREYERQRVLHIVAPKGRDSLTIGQEPEREVIKVLLQEQMAPMDFQRVDPWSLVARPDVVLFRAKRMSWRAGTGHTVTWWTWEPTR